jgi:hypothetical protein
MALYPFEGDQQTQNRVHTTNKQVPLQLWHSACNDENRFGGKGLSETTLKTCLSLVMTHFVVLLLILQEGCINQVLAPCQQHHRDLPSLQLVKLPILTPHSQRMIMHFMLESRWDHTATKFQWRCLFLRHHFGLLHRLAGAEKDSTEKNKFRT